jgi:hypothetical protein
MLDRRDHRWENGAPMQPALAAGTGSRTTALFLPLQSHFVAQFALRWSNCSIGRIFAESCVQQRQLPHLTTRQLAVHTCIGPPGTAATSCIPTTGCGMSSSN